MSRSPLLSVAAIFSLAILVCRASAEDVVEEPPRKTPVLYDVDVVVVGGELSGVGAALGAARSGAKTLVIERTGYLGGWMRGTGLGNVLAVPGWRPALKEGVLVDITRKLVELGAEDHTSLDAMLKYGQLPVANYELMPHAFQSLVQESGAHILYFSTYAGSIVTDGKISAILVETPVGRRAIRGKVFIDCTGMATVAAESGARVKKTEALLGLACTISGVDVKRHVAYEKALPSDPDPEASKWLVAKVGHAITTYNSEGPTEMNFPWNMWLERQANLFGKTYRDAVDKGETPLFYRVGEKGILSSIEGLKTIEWDVAGGIARPRTWITGVDPTSIQELNEAHIKSTQYLFALAGFLRKHVPGFERSQITRMADMTMSRAGRSVDNDFATTEEGIVQNTMFPDAIAVTQRGEAAGVFEVPYRAMLAHGVDNLLAVGKSSSGTKWFRLHSLSVIMGQAAGTAAAMAARDGIAFKDIDVQQLQTRLRDSGISIPEK